MSTNTKQIGECDEWEVCETCYKRIYKHNGIQDINRIGIYFCTQECHNIFQLKMMYCESCGVRIREDKLIDERCISCHKNYLNWVENYKMKL